MRFEWQQHAAAISISLWAAFGLGVHSTTALAQTPTAEQLKAYQALPAAQRDALLQQMGAARSGTSPASTATPNEILVQHPGSSQDDSQTAAGDSHSAMPLESTIKGNEQLLIELALPQRAGQEPIVRTPEQERRLELRRTEILARNPFELSAEGVLQLPGFAPIPLSGLTQKEVQARLALDPMLRDYALAVTILRLDAQGTRALKPFGYDLFHAGATAFVPGTDIPVPAEYKLGPGDVVSVQLYGQQSQTYAMPVGRDGTISFPELGPISVGGLGYGATQTMLEKRVRQQMIGTQARVTLGELRSVRVLVLGDAQRPGSYVVSSLSTVTNALFASGGVKPIGSLRNIEVKRDGKLLGRLDLYNVLLNGDTSTDVRLQTGDVVLVRPVGATAGIDGEVRRPAIYELAHERTLAELIAMAGGMSAEADPSSVSIERIGPGGAREAIGLDLANPADRGLVLKPGDVARVAGVRPLVSNGIELSGHVYRPGPYAWREGLRLADILRSVDYLKPFADLHYVLVRREAPDTRRISVFSADLGAALADRNSAANIPLTARDRITVFDTVSPRERVVDPLLAEARRQSQPEDPASVVSVEGLVNAPGTYPLEPGMHVSDLLRAGGGLQDAAYVVSAELARYTVADGARRRTDILAIDLSALRHGDKAADATLSPYDVLSIRTTPEWGRLEKIELTGEVNFPGTYPIRRGETLRAVIERAGGLTALASVDAAVFTREELKTREREQLDRLAARLERDLATVSLQASQAPASSSQAGAQALAAGQGLLDQLRHAQPVGRLVIDLPALLAGRPASESDIDIRDGDRLVVPRRVEEVSVLGEVQNSTSHHFRRGLTQDGVIALSGGLTAHADKKRAYVVRADGSVLASNSGWFHSGNAALRPGDTVVVPTDTQKIPPLPMWTAVTTIIYNLAIAATAVARL